jgi:heterodisulfide reductase subunit B
VKCNYCSTTAEERTLTMGKYADCTHWDCPQCGHAWMDDEQEEQRKRINIGLDIKEIK